MTDRSKDTIIRPNHGGKPYWESDWSIATPAELAAADHDARVPITAIAPASLEADPAQRRAQRLHVAAPESKPIRLHATKPTPREKVQCDFCGKIVRLNKGLMVRHSPAAGERCPADPAAFRPILKETA